MKKVVLVVAFVLLASSAYAAKFTFETTDENATRFVNASCGFGNYQAQIQDESGQTINNPETRAQFAKRALKGYMVALTKRWEASQAAQMAMNGIGEITVAES